MKTEYELLKDERVRVARRKGRKPFLRIVGEWVLRIACGCLFVVGCWYALIYFG